MKTAGMTLLLLLLLGCQTKNSLAPVTLSLEQAQTLACGLANEKARALYKCEPFRNEADPRFSGGRWEWRQRRGCGNVDLEARVSFAQDGSAQKVDVQLLDSRSSLRFERR
jgi:hypothetical protein